MRRTEFAVTAVVLLIGVALLGAMALFWVSVLEPRLKREATSQAEILARSQSNVIASALLSGKGPDRVRNVVRAMDDLLLLRDEASKTPFFQSVELQVDYTVIDAESGTLDLRRGDPMAREGFRTEVAIYNPQTDELLAVAWFQVSDRFYQQMSGDLRRSLWTLLLGGLVVLVVLGSVLAMLLRNLQRQTLERARAERELSQQEQRYEHLVNNLSAYFVYRRDAAGQVTFVSNSIQRVLGLTPEAAIERMHARPPAVGEAAARVYEFEIADQNGDLHHIELTEVPSLDETRVLTGWDGIARDMTTQRMFEEELRHAKEQAEAASRAKSQFLANMSHEIRTPLNAIVGMTGLALKSDVEPRVRNFLDKIRASAHLLTDIIEDILDLSRIEAGRLEIQRIDFDLDELLSDVSDVVGVKAADKNVEILFSAAPDVRHRLRGDPVRLKQVLLNLLGNALKFTTKGEIVVEISTVEARRDVVELKFSVRDTGIGIAAEHLETLFEPFTQVDASMTRRFGGAGLGLAISRRLVDMMGGTLHVESTPGKGSTFSFTAAFDLPRGASGPRRLADEFRDLPVLVADDNANARIVLSNMLRSLSCKVTVVESGEEAVAEATRAAAQGAPYRLAVLDWKMPGMDGAETAEKMATRERWPSPWPVILVTAYDRDDAMRRAEKAGIEVVLHKPVSPSMLHDAVLRILDPQAQRATRREATATTPAQFAPGQHVLLVEDNSINREVAHEMLAATGLHVTEAHNGVQALRLLDAQTFDLVMMDVQMPELDGVECVQAIRAQERFKKLPVVAITAHAMLGDRERFLAAGMSDYVAKPIEESELLRVLGRFLKTADTNRAATLEVDDGVRHVSGNVALYQRLVHRLDADNYDLMPRLTEMLQRGARDEALILLHTLKGSAATLGARDLAAAAAAVEQALLHAPDTTPSLDPLAQALQQFSVAAARVPKSGVEISHGAQPGGIEHALPLVRRLASLLPENNFAALDCFKELKNVVGRSPSLAEIEDALDRLDFQAAIPHVTTLEHELTRTITQ